ncbi:MAG: glycosyltransferase family 39 protein [Candidatus Kuenenia sp.]|nr:glycosyltransferase family 39 protein [Candidatus Kuenenia hertensis]
MNTIVITGKKSVWYFVGFLAGIFLLFWKLEDTAGLHRDEAMFGLLTEMILEGARPLTGIFNNYTSPVHSYMLAVCVKIFGNSIWSLRCLGPVFTLITIAAIFDIIRQHSTIRARWTSCLLLTFPPIIMLSRLCGEVFVLNPFLFFGTIWIYVKLCNSSKKSVRITGWGLTGFCLSFGIWNHIIFLPSAVSLVICYALFMWPGLRRFLLQCAPCAIGFSIGLVPRFASMMVLGMDLFPKRPSIPPASLKNALLNLLYTLSGDGLYARFSGGSVLPFVWGIPVIVAIFTAMFYFLKHNKSEKKMFWGIVVFIAINFVGIWQITPFGSVGSRVWLIIVWMFPILLGLCLTDVDKWKFHILGGAMIAVHLPLLAANYYIPCIRSNGTIEPSVYVGGKTDNTWDYYDHRQITETLLQSSDAEYIFISNINVFTFYYLAPENQRHRIKLLWPIILGGGGDTPEKRIIYDQVTYNGSMPKSALFVFYDTDKDYLDYFSRQSFYNMTSPDRNITFPGFFIYRLR